MTIGERKNESVWKLGSYYFEEGRAGIGFIIENLNIGVIHSKGEYCSGDFSEGDEVYFNKRNAVEILEYFIVKNEDIYMVIE